MAITDSKANFKIRAAFQIELRKRYFFLAGEILSGRIKIGLNADLSNIGIDKRYIIEGIEMADNWEGKRLTYEVLCISGLTEEEKEILKSGAPFDEPILII